MIRGNNWEETGGIISQLSTGPNLHLGLDFKILNQNRFHNLS